MQDLLNRVVPPKSGLLSGSVHPHMGGVYNLAEHDTLVVIWSVDKEYGVEMTNVIPMFKETEMASHQDLLLPRDLMGHRVAVAPDMLFTMLTDDLNEYLGTLPLKYIGGILDYIQGGSKPLQRGLPYLDENDVRFVWHEDLIEDLQPLMGRALKVVIES